jgi:sulfur carrier protein
MACITILVNNVRYEMDETTTIEALLATLKLDASQMAVARNGELLPRHRYPHTVLSEGDAITTIPAVAGG